MQIERRADLRLEPHDPSLVAGSYRASAASAHCTTLVATVPRSSVPRANKPSAVATRIAAPGHERDPARERGTGPAAPPRARDRDGPGHSPEPTADETRQGQHALVSPSEPDDWTADVAGRVRCCAQDRHPCARRSRTTRRDLSPRRADIALCTRPRRPRSRSASECPRPRARLRSVLVRGLGVRRRSSSESSRFGAGCQDGLRRNLTMGRGIRADHDRAHP